MPSQIPLSCGPNQSAPNQLKRRAFLVAAGVLWAPAVGYGIHTMLQYAKTPGRPASPPHKWPRGAQVQPQSGKATLLVFAHPHCPCSRATVGELAWILSRSQQSLQARVFFYSPVSKPDGWTKTALWADASAISGVEPLADYNGLEARRFGASTSGQTLLYDDTGRLLFSGGITAARGHSGPNSGRESLLALLQRKTLRLPATPVFGCSLTGGV